MLGPQGQGQAEAARTRLPGTGSAAAATRRLQPTPSATAAHSEASKVPQQAEQDPSATRGPTRAQQKAVTERFSRSRRANQAHPDHTGHKPFQCRITSRNFFMATTSHYSHPHPHWREALFACDYCGPAGTCSDERKRHTKIHLRQKERKSSAPCGAAVPAASSASCSPGDAQAGGPCAAAAAAPVVEVPAALARLGPDALRSGFRYFYTSSEAPEAFAHWSCDKHTILPRFLHFIGQRALKEPAAPPPPSYPLRSRS